LDGLSYLREMMDNVSVVMFIIAGVSTLIGSFYLVYITIGNQQERIEESKSCEIEEYKKLQERIDKLRSELEEFGDERVKGAQN
tara:strand:- start:2773 stop:3024 length:252 start_codon:yes stop_codon:yes gene_type:complete